MVGLKIAYYLLLHWNPVLQKRKEFYIHCCLCVASDRITQVVIEKYTSKDSLVRYTPFVTPPPLFYHSLLISACEYV